MTDLIDNITAHLSDYVGSSFDIIANLLWQKGIPTTKHYAAVHTSLNLVKSFLFKLTPNLIVMYSESKYDDKTKSHYIDEEILIDKERDIYIRLVPSHNDDKVYIRCINFPFQKELDEFTAKYPPSATDLKSRIFVMNQTECGLQKTELSFPFVDLERGNYTKEQVACFDHILHDLISAEPCGRLIILDGAPGTGKSFFVKGIIKNTNNLFLLVPASLVSQLDSPSLLGFLLTLHEEYHKHPIALIIEDADQCLLPRDGMNMSSISSLLNLGDGVLGAALNIRLICTTNAKSLEIDKALLRSGRLCSSVHIGLLEKEHASEIYERLTGKKKVFKDKVTLSEVYGLTKNEGHKKEDKSTRAGFI